MKLLCVDTETTGLDTNTCEIIELGYALYDTDIAGQTPVLVHADLVTPKELITEEIQGITGINQHMLNTYAVNPDEAINNFINTVNEFKPHFIIGHNLINYDLPIIQRYIGLISTENPLDNHPVALDTYIDLPHKKTPKSNSLIYLCADTAKFVNPFSHRALFDCLATMKLFFSFDIAAIAASAMSPLVHIRADVNFEKKDLARAMGYAWNADKRIWEKTIRLSRLADEQQKAKFPVITLEQKKLTVL